MKSFVRIILICCITAFCSKSYAQELIEQLRFNAREFNGVAVDSDQIYLWGKTHISEEVAAALILDRSNYEENREIKSGRPSGSHHGGLERYYHSFSGGNIDAEGNLFLRRFSAERFNHYSSFMRIAPDGNIDKKENSGYSPLTVIDDTLFTLLNDQVRLLNKYNFDEELGNRYDNPDPDVYSPCPKPYYFWNTPNTLERINEPAQVVDISGNKIVHDRVGFSTDFLTEERISYSDAKDEFLYTAQNFDRDTSFDDYIQSLTAVVFNEEGTLWKVEKNFEHGVLGEMENIKTHTDNTLWAVCNDPSPHLVKLTPDLDIDYRFFISETDMGEYVDHILYDDRVYLLTYKDHQTTLTILSARDESVSSQNNLSGKTQNVQLFPNPAHDRVNIETDITDAEIKLYDLKGTLMLNKKSRNASFDISEFPAGVYVVRVAGNQNTETYKLIKQ